MSQVNAPLVLLFLLDRRTEAVGVYRPRSVLPPRGLHRKILCRSLTLNWLQRLYWLQRFNRLNSLGSRQATCLGGGPKISIGVDPIHVHACSLIAQMKIRSLSMPYYLLIRAASFPRARCSLQTSVHLSSACPGGALSSIQPDKGADRAHWQHSGP